MSTEQDMLDALIQHQVYTHRASTKVVNELNRGFTSATNTFANRLRELLDELTDSEREALTAGKYTTDTLKELREAFSEYYNISHSEAYKMVMFFREYFQDKGILENNVYEGIKELLSKASSSKPKTSSPIFSE